MFAVFISTTQKSSLGVLEWPLIMWWSYTQTYNIYSLISFSFIYSSPSSLLFFASLQLNWRFEFNFFAWWNIMRLFLGSLYLMCAYFPGISYIISTLKIPLLVWLNVSLPTHYSTLLLQGEPPTASPFFNNSLSAYCVPINRNMTRNSALNT